MIVDSHVHVIAEDEQRYPFDSLSVMNVDPATAWYRTTPVSAERLIAEMDAAGVDRAMVVQPWGAYSYDNSYHADSAARYPDRFVGVCTVDASKDDAPERLSYWVEERGMRGLRLNSSAFPLDDPRAQPLWERVDALGIPVCVLTKVEHLEQVRARAQRFPNVRIALDHLGGWGGYSGSVGAAVRALLDLVALPNLYLKVSTVNFAPVAAGDSDALEALRQLVDGFGARRMIWGSNYPVSQEGTYADMVRMGRDALPFLSDEDRRWMLGETAVSLWPALKGLA